MKQDLDAFTDTLAQSFPKNFDYHQLPEDQFTHKKYPKLLPMMKFHVKGYEIETYGHLFTMYTNGMKGMMQLFTLVFTPNKGKNVPFFLLDGMVMKKKQCVFVEFYDCTKNHLQCPSLQENHQKFASFPEYSEKPAWYISERTKDSLIKGGDDQKALLLMAQESVSAYAHACKDAGTDQANLIGLRVFQERMLKDGNPSSATLEKVLGKEEAAAFFRHHIMPCG